MGAYVSDLNPGFNPSKFWEVGQAAEAFVCAVLCCTIHLNPQLWQVVTYDASPEAGAAKHCRRNTRRLFDILLTPQPGLRQAQEVANAFSLCAVPRTGADYEQLAYWIQVGDPGHPAGRSVHLAVYPTRMLRGWAMLQGAFDAMAMGNYPFASSYMGGALPPWPMRAACDILADESPSDGQLLRVRLCPSLHGYAQQMPEHASKLCVCTQLAPLLQPRR